MLELTTELYETDSVAIFIFLLRSRLKDFHFFFPLYRSSFHVSHHMNHQKGVTFISKHSQLATGGGDERWREDKKYRDVGKDGKEGREWEKDGDDLDF